MYSSKDAANPAYPTQWALNPTAYQNVDSSEVDWAALAQQWIAMKEAAAVMAAPPPPSMKPEAEEGGGEAPMEVESTDTNDSMPSGGEWNAATNSWGGGGWNQWGWGWPGSGGVDPKMGGDPSLNMPPMMDSYSVPPDAASQMPGYTTGPVPAPTFQHGYWTAPQPEQPNRTNSSQDRRSKSKNREHKPSRPPRPPREKPSMVPPVVSTMAVPAGLQSATIDAAKRRQLPAWIREGLEKMEREKQRAIEREQEKKARELAEIEKKKQEEEELERMKAEAGGQPVLPPKSKFESDSETEDMEKEEPAAPSPVKEESAEEEEDEPVQPLLIHKSKEEIMQEIMLAVRRSLTEILLEVTDQEIHTVSQEEYNRYTTAQATRLNEMKASKSKALAAIASGLGLGAYESSSEGSGDEDEQNERDISDQQLQEIIRRKRQEFERTARDIEAEVRRAELREQADEAPTPLSSTPEKPSRTSRSSATPPPVDSDTPEKLPDRITKDKKTNKSTDKTDGVRKLETIIEEKPKKKKDHIPSPKSVKSNNKEHSSTSDSEDDSSSSSSESDSEIEKDKSRKRKRRISRSSDSQKKKSKRKKSHKEERNSSKYYEEDKEKSSYKKKEERHKTSRKEYDRHRDKYREDSEDDRRRRSHRSRSNSYESRRSSSRRERREDRDRDYREDRDRREERDRDRREERDRDRREERDRDRREERDRDRRDRSRDYDRYERSRDYDRRRSRSRR